MSLVEQGLPLHRAPSALPDKRSAGHGPGNYLQWPTGEGHACPRALRHIGVGSLNHQFATVTVPGLSRWYLIIGVGFKPAYDPPRKASRNLSMVQRAPQLRRGPVLYGDLRLAYSGHLCTNQAAVFRVLAIYEIRSAWPSLNGCHGDPWDCPQRLQEGDICEYGGLCSRYCLIQGVREQRGMHTNGVLHARDETAPIGPVNGTKSQPPLVNRRAQEVAIFLRFPCLWVCARNQRAWRQFGAVSCPIQAEEGGGASG